MVRVEHTKGNLGGTGQVCLRVGFPSGLERVHVILLTKGGSQRLLERGEKCLFSGRRWQAEIRTRCLRSAAPYRHIQAGPADSSEHFPVNCLPSRPYSSTYYTHLSSTAGGRRAPRAGSAGTGFRRCNILIRGTRAQYTRRHVVHTYTHTHTHRRASGPRRTSSHRRVPPKSCDAFATNKITMGSKTSV